MNLSPSAHVDTYCRENLPPETQWPDFLLDSPDTSYPVRLNCATALLDDVIAERGAERPCLLAPGEDTWSYGRLLAVSNRIAGYLSGELGIVPGNRVLLRGPNNPWLIACWFGVLKAGGVVVATMPLLRSGELRSIHEIARINLVLCDFRFVDELEAAALAGAPTIAFGGSSDDDLAQKIVLESDIFEAVDTAADDVSMLGFTSGTTGRPKATMHFHRDVLAIADTFSKHIVKATSDDVFAGTPPIAFTFGLGAAVIFPLRVGASTLLIEKATPLELAKHIGAENVSVCFTAPTAYRAMIAAGEAKSLGSLRRAISAGEHLDAPTWQAFFESTGIKIIDGIGSTEMLHVFISAADDDIRPGSTGLPVPGYEAKIIDHDGNTVPDGTAGRLAVKGPTGCRYLADKRQLDYVADGWNITGDTFVRDADGYFWYKARSDDMIVSSGYNIAGPEVEEAIHSHPSVLDCAVVGIPDVARGSLVTAFVVLKEGVSPDPDLVDSIQKHVKAVIAPYKYPRQVHFIDELPRTGTGKLQRFRLRPPTNGS